MDYRRADPDAQRVAADELRAVAERALEKQAADRAALEVSATHEAAIQGAKSADAARRRYLRSFHWAGWFACGPTAIVVLLGLAAIAGVLTGGESGVYVAAAFGAPALFGLLGGLAIRRAAVRERTWLAALPFSVRGHEELLSVAEPAGLQGVRCTFDGPPPDAALVQGLLVDAGIEATASADDVSILLRFAREASLSGYEAHRRFRRLAPVLVRLHQAYPIGAVALS